MYYRSSQNRFQAGRPSAPAVNFLHFGNIRLHTSGGYFTLRGIGTSETRCSSDELMQDCGQITSSEALPCLCECSRYFQAVLEVLPVGYQGSRCDMVLQSAYSAAVLFQFSEHFGWIFTVTRMRSVNTSLASGM